MCLCNVCMCVCACVYMVCVHVCVCNGITELVLQVEIDRRMLDFCVGLDTEFSEIVEGSHLYYPKTKFEQVDVTGHVTNPYDR